MMRLVMLNTMLTIWIPEYVPTVISSTMPCGFNPKLTGTCVCPTLSRIVAQERPQVAVEVSSVARHWLDENYVL